MSDQHAGKAAWKVDWTGALNVDPVELERAIREGWLDTIEGWDVEQTDDGEISFGSKPNLVVNNGITRVQNLGWAIGGGLQAVNCMSVDNGAAAPAAGSTSLTSDATPPTAWRIQSFDSAATQTAQVVSQIATFTQAGVTFVMKRLALSFIAVGSLPLTNPTAVPAASLHSMTPVFTIDLTGFTTWSQAFTATVTGTGS